MGEKEEFLTELMQQVQREYMQFVEIEKLTKELGDMLSSDDRESVQLLLGMRQEAMDQVDEIKRNINAILEAVGSEDAEEMRILLDCEKEFPETAAGFEAEKIREISRQIKNSLDRTISTDKIISRKLAGNDSYYSK